MNKTYKLYNQIKHYEWGSQKLMPDFLGINNPGNMPYAEMWMGTHIGAPSFAENVPLKEISGDLPFLFKLLAVEKPLSIQAHPNLERAKEGFRLEEESGVDVKSPMRNYKDQNHKPELLCAITCFSFMAGFRRAEDIKKSLSELLAVIPQLKEIIKPLMRSFETGSLAVFFRLLFELTEFEKEYISNLIKDAEIKDEEHINSEQWALMKLLALQYPKDPAIISPLYLNYITLKPGEAVYLPPGLLHSYVSGFGAEIMPASDNVLRGGLTPKYINIPELMNVLNFKPYLPKIISPSSLSWFNYGGDGFSLAVLKGDGSDKVFNWKEPVICLVTEGELKTRDAVYKKGESFFIPKDAGEFVFNGVFSAFFASSDLNGEPVSSR